MSEDGITDTERLIIEALHAVDQDVKALNDKLTELQQTVSEGFSVLSLNDNVARNDLVALRSEINKVLVVMQQRGIR